MKNTAYLSLFLLASALFSWLGAGWWLIALGGLLGGFFIKNRPIANFLAAFSVGFLLWSLLAFWQSTANAHRLAGMTGEIFKGLKASHLVYATGFLGGLLAGLSALTGTYLRKALIAPSRKGRYMEQRR